MLQFIGTGLVFALAIYWYMGKHTENPDFTLPAGTLGLVLLVTPGAFSIAGLVQLISGVPFSELSNKWNSLKGWQRGVYGTLIFLGALALIFGGFMFMR